MKYRDCYLCGSSDLEELSHKARSNLSITNVICRDCGLVFQNPIKEEKELKSVYQKGDYTKTHYENDFENVLNNFVRIAEMQYNFIDKNYDINKKGRLLDIGTGVGSVLSVFGKKGFEVEGVEPDPEAADFIKKKLNCKVYNDMFDNIDFKRKYDLVMISHVLEHVVDPISFLEKVREIVNNNSIVFIEVPDVQKIYPHYPDWYEWFEEGHLYSFSLDTLNGILSKTNYDILTTQRDNVYKWGVLRAIITPTKSKKSPENLHVNAYNKVKRSIQKVRIRYFIRKNSGILRYLYLFFKSIPLKIKKTLSKQN